jgi:hypothetical protein
MDQPLTVSNCGLPTSPCRGLQWLGSGQTIAFLPVVSFLHPFFVSSYSSMDSGPDK